MTHQSSEDQNELQEAELDAVDVASEEDDAPISQKHADRATARESKQKRLEAQLRNNLRRRKSQSRARKD